MQLEPVACPVDLLRNLIFRLPAPRVGIADKLLQRWRLVRLARKATVRAAEPPRRAVTYLAFSGLGNRLKAHMMAAEIARRTGRELAVWWPRTPHYGGAFDELFEHGPTPLPRLGSPYVLEYDNATDRPATEHWEAIEEDLIVLGVRWQYIWLENLRRRIGDHMEQALATLQPRREILREVEARSAGWDAQMIGVHVRLGDLVTHHTDFLVPVDRYIERMREIEKERGLCRFFLASDGTDEQLAPILREFGDRVEWRLPASRGSIEGADHALVDVLLLARTSLIIRNEKSTFAETSLLLGGAEDIRLEL